MLNDRSLHALPTASGSDCILGQSGWHAELNLGFSRANERTLLSRRHHKGPLTVQRPFYPDDGICHVYLLHPPGGIVGGDRLTIDVCAGTCSEALLTTPAATKFYRSSGPVATQSVGFQIGSDASMEWLPQETILYDGARLISEQSVDLDAQACFFGWEMLTFGRPAAGEKFATGFADLSWRLTRSGRPYYVERMRADPELIGSIWGLQGRPSCGTLFAFPASRSDLDTARDILCNGDCFGATLVDDLLICRGIADKVAVIQGLFIEIWRGLRPTIVGLTPYEPRIWAT